MTIIGKEMSDMEFQPFATTPDVTPKLIEDLALSVAEMFTVAKKDVDCFSVPDTCSLAEARMRHNSAQNAIGTTIDRIIRKLTQPNGLTGK